MNLQLDIQSASAEPAPEEDDLRSWITAVFDELGDRGHADAEISLRIVDMEEMAGLNLAYRGKNGPTNVLSFPADLPEELHLSLLGDIVICAPVVRREAAEQDKSEGHHFAHMTVHGTLHLLGYDHLAPGEADLMEQLETSILARLHIPCPYGNVRQPERVVT
ncbi:MAG: rRNA maturation RNase YbeY [Pseudomonadota bacterium]